MNSDDPNDLYENPAYLWGTGSENVNFVPRMNDGYLYHYTNPESLFKILQNMTLKFSKIGGLNDPSEGVVNWLGYEFKTFVEQLHVESSDVISRCSVISFARNFRPTRLSPVVPGTMHPRMWAQYGANNTGACICIRQDRFIQENRHTLKDSFYKFKKVKYGFGKPGLKYCGEDPIDFLKNHCEVVFFYKEIDWKQEDEIRFLGIDISEEYLSLENSIAYICLGAKFHNTIFKSRDTENPIPEWEGRPCHDILLSVLNDPACKCFKRFKDYSFARMSYIDGYLCEDTDYSFNGLIIENSIR